jgi:primosomal replication protein N
VAVGPTALLLKAAGPGAEMTASGFLAAKSLKQKSPVLHVTAIEFNEQI